MNLVLWIEVPDEFAENVTLMAALSAKAAVQAAAVNHTVTDHRVVESTEKPYHKLVCWDLAPLA